MGTKTGRVAGTAHVADDELLVGMAEIEFRFQTAVIKVPFREAVADEHKALAG